MSDITRKRRPPRTTYSRKPNTAASLYSASHDHAPKRRRLIDKADAIAPPSSPRSSSIPLPASETDNVAESSDTPASSPPPTSSPPPPKKKSHFSFFTRASAPSGRRRPGTSNAVSASSSSPSMHKKAKSQKPKKLTQMTIDLGQPLQVTCRACGMSYHPSTPDDEMLHKRFHAKSIGGVDFALKSLKDKDRSVVWKADEGDAHVLMVDRKVTSVEKRKAREVLEVADSELGAAEIEEKVLWGVVGDGDDEGGKFKVYLYVQGRKCVGLCLAERIKRGYPVLDDRGKGSSVSISDTAQPALLGISRIWTCSSHRRQGIAARLLDCARETFIYGMPLEKDMVAFSQPTESGGGLAKRWFGANKSGEEDDVEKRWLVYVEEV